MFWRRKQETMNDPTDPTPLDQAQTRAADHDLEAAADAADALHRHIEAQGDTPKSWLDEAGTVTFDQVRAEQAIRDARSDEPAPEWERKYLEGEAAGQPTGATGDDGAPDTFVQTVPDMRAHLSPSRDYLFMDTRPPQPSRNILAGAPVTAGRSAVPAPLVTADHRTCTACDGRGVMPNISDLLRESASWIDDMDGVIVAFYRRFLDIVRGWAEMKAKLDGADEWQQQQAGEDAVADAAFLFPPDLLSARGETPTRGTAQRDKLAEALVGLSALYDPTDAEKLERLDNVIKSMANRHNAFVRRNGTVRAATGLEYALVGVALLDTLATLGDRFTPAHAEAWSIAYDFTSGGMLQHQQRSGFSAPRFPRV